MCNDTELLLNVTETLWKRYGALQDVMERYGSATERYGTLCSVVERYETLRERYRAVAECHGALRSRYVTLWNHYGKYRVCPYGTECQ